jgi:hypothetical protein
VTAKVIPFTGITKLDMPPDLVLEQAKTKLEGVVIIGFDTDGGEYFASSYADGGTVLWLLERLKLQLLQVPDDGG